METSEVPCLLLYLERLPCPQKIPFDSLYVTNSENCRNHIRQLTHFRDEFIDSLAETNTNNIIESCERYIPYIYSLLPKSSNMSDPFKTIKPIKFIWTSALDAVETREYIVYTIYFEIIMTLLTCAFAYINSGTEIYQKNELQYKESIEKYKSAHDIFCYILKYEFEAWPEQSRPKDLILPPEMDKQTIVSLSQYCFALAQNTAICQISKNPDTQNSSLAKLSWYIEGIYFDMAETLSKSISFEERGYSAYFNFFIIQHFISFAMAQMFECNHEKQEYNQTKSIKNQHGNVCARMREGNKMLVSVQHYKNIGHLSSPQIEEFLKYFKSLKETYDKENETVYNEKIPAECPQIFKLMQLIKEKENPWLPNSPAFNLYETK